MKSTLLIKKYLLGGLTILAAISFLVPIKTEAWVFSPSGIAGTIGGKVLPKCPVAKPTYSTDGGGGLGGAIDLGKKIQKTFSGGLSGAIGGLTGGGGGSSDAVPILSSDIEREAAQRYIQKEIGNCKSLFNKPVPMGSWDSLYTGIAKELIRTITDDLVNWINGGANGAPKFVEDPEQLFQNVADRTSGEIINNLGLNGLCEPIRVNVMSSLATRYGGGSYTSDGNENPTCTFSGAKNNLENFLGDFKEGGWSGWLSMTQNDYNNPYGAYMNASDKIDKEIQKKIDIESQKLTWGRGFLSMKETACIAEADNGSCLKSEDKIITPGSYIENYLAQNSGSWVRQLELADEFDEIINASLGALTNAVLQKGLAFSGDMIKDAFSSAPDPEKLATADEEYATCLSDVSGGPIGTTVQWGADSTLAGSVTYGWSGDEIPVGKTGSTISVQYNLEGTKAAAVTAVGKDSTGKLRTLKATCENTVEIGSTSTSTPPVPNPTPNALSLSCYPETAQTTTNTDVRWIAEVTGGSGTIASVEWSGSDSEPGAWSASQDVLVPQEGSNPVKTLIYKTRQYSTEGPKAASVLVYDADQQFDPMQTVCSGILQVTNTTTGPAPLPQPI